MEWNDPELKKARIETLVLSLRGFLVGLFDPRLRISVVAPPEERRLFCEAQIKRIFPEAKLLPFAHAAIEQGLDFEMAELCAVLLTVELDHRSTLTSLVRSLIQPHRLRDEEDLRAMAKILEPEVKRLKANRFDQLAESLLGVRRNPSSDDRPIY